MRPRTKSPKSGLGRCVYSFRFMRQMSFDDIAAATGLSKGILSNIETQQLPNPCYETLKKLATAFDVSMANFLAVLSTHEKK